MIRSRVRRPIPGRENVVALAFARGRNADWLLKLTPWWQVRKRARRRRAFERYLKLWVDNSRWELVNGCFATPKFPHCEW